MRAFFVMQKFSIQRLLSNSLKTNRLNQHVERGRTHQPNSCWMSSKAWANLKSCRIDATIVFMLTRASSTWKASTSTEPSFGRITSAGHSIVSTTFCSRRSKDSRKNATYPGSRGAAYHNSDRRSDFGGRGGELEGVQQRSMPLPRQRRTNQATPARQQSDHCRKKNWILTWNWSGFHCLKILETYALAIWSAAHASLLSTLHCTLQKRNTVIGVSNKNTVE